MATTGKPYAIPEIAQVYEQSTTGAPVPYVITTTGGNTVPYSWYYPEQGIKLRKKEGRYSELSSEYRWLDPEDNEDHISDFPTDFSRLIDILEERVKIAFPLNGIPDDIETQFISLKEKLSAAEKELDNFIKNVSEYFLIFQRLEE